jgi:hypothetical protein
MSAKAVAAKVNPMIAAVLKEIPGAGSSRAQRITWLRMIAMAMDTVYGADSAALDIPDFLGAAPQPLVALADSPNAQQSAPGLAPAAPAPQKPQLVRVVEPPRFFIDHAGAARHAPSMEPINPEQIGDEPLFDDRGEFGELGSIVWADGRRGVLGLRLNISATPAAKRA